MKNKKINWAMLVLWTLFLWLMLPLGIITGIFKGLWDTLIQAKFDILNEDSDELQGDETDEQ